MKQVIHRSYGSVDVLQMVDVPSPAPAENQVRVTVRAVGLNPLDWKIFEGQMKLLTGSKFPRGVAIEFAGVVSAVGGRVSRFGVGDEVFGMLDAFHGGALAEELVVSEDAIVAKPPALSFVQAAALPVGGLSALQIVDELAGIREGARVLINGATGGVGAFATQIAKRRGAVVTAAVSTRGIPLADKWKCDTVVDYTKGRVDDARGPFDAVIDLAGRLPYVQAKAQLAETSVYVNSLPDPKVMLAGFVHNLFSSRKRRVLRMRFDGAQLVTLGEYASDWLEVVVGSTYPMAEFKKAYADTQHHGVLGKAVITI